MERIDQLLEELEQDPELQAIKAKLTRLESAIKGRVTDDLWQLILDWEAEWAAYATRCAQRLYPLAYRDGVREGQQQAEGRE